MKRFRVRVPVSGVTIYEVDAETKKAAFAKIESSAPDVKIVEPPFRKIKLSAKSSWRVLQKEVIPPQEPPGEDPPPTQVSIAVAIGAALKM